MPASVHSLAYYWVCFIALAWTSCVKADWINLTGAETSPNIAEIYVLDDHVKLVLEVVVADLEVFEELIPDQWLQDLDVDRPAVSARMQNFAAQTFQFITDSGEQLSAELVLVEPRMRVDRQSPFAGMINPFTRQRVPEAPTDKRVLYAEILYPFKDKPQTLTMIPPRDEEERAKVSIGFIAYHKAVPIIDFRYLGAAAKVHLDWEDPWYSKFENPNLKRHHKDALMSFLYVEPYEVRHEILTRVKDLETWMDLGLRGDLYIEVDELAPLQQRIGEFLLTKNQVLVDDQALKPILDRTNYVKVGIKGIQLIEQPERLEISTAIVGVIITYLTQQLPQSVKVNWELFSDEIQRVPATSIDPAGPLMSYVEPSDNLHTWTNFLKNYEVPKVEQIAIDNALGELQIPVASLVLLGLLIPVVWHLKQRRSADRPLKSPMIIAAVLIAGSAITYPYFRVPVTKPTMMVKDLSDEQATIITQTLLKNVYRAFDFRDEEDVYDKLALTVSGDLLSDIYLQNRKSLAVQKAGGAQAKIKQVEILETSAERLSDKPFGFSFKSKWTAMGTVGHWGHVHMRQNLYEAILTVEAVDGNWKITGLDLLEEKRIDPGASPAIAANATASSSQNM